MIIKDNFLVVSNYNNDISWIPKYGDKYLVYNKEGSSNLSHDIDKNKIINTPNVGYNLYDYFTFIIDNYNKLPECTIFMKGNTFPRHISQEYFDRIVNNNYFTPIEDYRMHKSYSKNGVLICFFSSDGGFSEINNSWYLGGIHPTKYFHNYNDFINYCFIEPVIPKYIRFAPGANYIVPRENILKLPKIFYENLRVFISHSQLPGEAHIIERSLHTLWNCNFEINPKMLKPIDNNFKAIPPLKKDVSEISFVKRAIRKIISILKRYE